MDIITTTGLLALAGVCYLMLTLRNASHPAIQIGIAVPADSRSGFVGDHTAAAAKGARRPRTSDQTLDHCTVWRPPQMR